MQDSSDISKLKNIVQIFVPDSAVNKRLREEFAHQMKTSLTADEIKTLLITQPVKISFALLVGRGPLKGETRANASCSGIAQAVLPAQNGRPYQSDWATKSFVLWAIAIGFINYDDKTDNCTLSESGKLYANAEGEQEMNLLREAHCLYPPVCRILNILNETPDEYLTKFEIGRRFGFVGEDGFTSYSLRFILDGLRHCVTTKEKNTFLQNTEGTSDKYVRTIASWLIKLGLIESGRKRVSAMFKEEQYDCELVGYRLTYEGRKIINSINGGSKHKKKSKIVHYGMLATKAVDAKLLRYRRALLLNFISAASFRTVGECVTYLDKHNIVATEDTVKDDIRGFENIGLSVRWNEQGKVKIADTIVGLSVPTRHETVSSKSIVEQEKEQLRSLLINIDHKYLALIDLGYGKGNGADRKYELMTADLLTSELDFAGQRMGESSKPDVCVSYDDKGLIIDNKAYEDGFSLPIKQADEMIRYIEENKLRDVKLNKNEWWTIFSENVRSFSFLFVSGKFVGSYTNRLEYISNRTQVNGAAITSANLLYLAEQLKSQNVTYTEAIDKLRKNKQFVLLPSEVSI